MKLPLGDCHWTSRMICQLWFLWCLTAASRYLSQCWPNYISQHDVTKPQWVERYRLSTENIFEPFNTNSNFENTSVILWLSLIHAAYGLALALLGAKPSVGILMTKICSRIYTGPALQGLNTSLLTKISSQRFRATFVDLYLINAWSHFT